MTTPSGGTGSSGFEYGPDSVAARLSVDVPPEGIQTLHQLAKEAENLRVQMEALVRAEGDHIGMVQQMSEIHAQVANSTRGLTEEMSRLSTANNMGSAGGGGGMGGGIYPTGTLMDPFSGAGGAGMARMAEQMANDPRGFMNATAQHGGDTTAVIDQGSMNELAQIISQGIQQGMVDEMADMGMGPGTRPAGGGGGRGGGGGGRPPAGPGSHGRASGGGHDDDDGPDPERDRLAQIEGMTNSGVRLAGQFMNEMGPGGITQGMGGAMMNVLRTAGGGEGGGMLGTLMGAAGRVGPAGAALGVGLAANQLMQMGGQQFQELQNQGMVRGGGAGEGFNNEMQARGLALNPFISTEQARQVIQGALSEGYQGKSFDKVTDFMVHNLREMNMSVGESIESLKTNVNSTGESIVGLSSSLSSLKESSKDGVKSFDSLKSSFSQASGTLSEGGMNAGTNVAAGAVANTFKDNKVLSDSGFANRFLSSAVNDPSQAYLSQVQGFAAKNNPGLMSMMPQDAFNTLGGSSAEALWVPIMKQFRATGNDIQDARTLMQLVNGSNPGVNMSINEAQELLPMIKAGKNPGSAGAAAQSKANSAVNSKSLMQQVGGTTGAIAGGFFSAIGGGLKDLGGRTADFFTGRDSSYRDQELAASSQRTKDNISRSASKDTNPIVDSLMDEYGYNGLEIQQNGKTSRLDPKDRAQLDALAQGKAKVRGAGQSEFMTLDQAQGIKKGDATQVSGQVAINITAAPGIQYQAPKSIPISSNAERAMRGYGDSTMNNMPPGG